MKTTKARPPKNVFPKSRTSIQGLDEKLFAFVEANAVNINVP